MKSTLNKLGVAIALATGMASAQAAYIESGDASNFLASAQLATDMTIQGAIGQGDEGDVFKLVFGSAGTLTIQATSSQIDTNIGLFDAGFNALAGDDDSGGGLNSLLSYAIGAGTYYIGIGNYAMYAFNASNPPWFLDGLPPATTGRGVLHRQPGRDHPGRVYAVPVAAAAEQFGSGTCHRRSAGPRPARHGHDASQGGLRHSHSV